jgi:hypothetical protein
MTDYMLKLDVDLKVPKEWLEDWLETRRAIYEALGFKILGMVVDKKSERGFHAFVHILSNTKLTPDDLNKLQWLGGDDRGRVLINAWRIKRGVPWERGNKLFDHVIWRKEHKCNCTIHQKILKRAKEGQDALMGIK